MHGPEFNMFAKICLGCFLRNQGLGFYAGCRSTQNSEKRTFKQLNFQYVPHFLPFSRQCPWFCAPVSSSAEVAAAYSNIIHLVSPAFTSKTEFCLEQVFYYLSWVLLHARNFSRCYEIKQGIRKSHVSQKHKFQVEGGAGEMNKQSISVSDKCYKENNAGNWGWERQTLIILRI